MSKQNFNILLTPIFRSAGGIHLRQVKILMQYALYISPRLSPNSNRPTVMLHLAAVRVVAVVGVAHARI
jgi:hypothetical protein